MKTKTTYTPGPWQHWIPRWPPGYDGPARAIGQKGKRPLFKTLGDNEALNEANARLVAAAPEMLEALKECKTWTSRYLGVSGLLDMVENAIAKAEGSEQ